MTVFPLMPKTESHNGSKTVVNGDRKGQSPEEQTRASSSAFVYMPFVTPQLVIESYERYNEIAREVARKTGALLIEREHDIPGDPAHFTDTAHFTDLGSKAMAKRIAAALASSQEVRTLLDTAAPKQERLPAQ